MSVSCGIALERSGIGKLVKQGNGTHEGVAAICLSEQEDRVEPTSTCRTCCTLPRRDLHHHCLIPTPPRRLLVVEPVASGLYLDAAHLPEQRSTSSSTTNAASEIFIPKLSPPP